MCKYTDILSAGCLHTYLLQLAKPACHAGLPGLMATSAGHMSPVCSCAACRASRIRSFVICHAWFTLSSSSIQRLRVPHRQCATLLLQDKGVQNADGDGTVPIISTGLMCYKGWRNNKKLNPAGIPIVSREYLHQPSKSYLDLRCAQGQAELS